MTELGDPQAGGIEGGEDRAMLEVAWGKKQCFDLLSAERLFEKFRPL